MVGPVYRSDTVFDLAKMEPYALTDLLIHFRQLTGDIVLYLPRTSDIRQLAKSSISGSKMTVMHYCMEGASKVCYVFFIWMSNCNKNIGSLRVLWSFYILLSSI